MDDVEGTGIAIGVALLVGTASAATLAACALSLAVRMLVGAFVAVNC